MNMRSFVTSKKYTSERGGKLVCDVFHCHNRDSLFVYYLVEDSDSGGSVDCELFAHCCPEHQKDMPDSLF
ncbi:putative F-box containing protein [Tokyovirus A1]|uniref:putative F-box containing protein n=1 Tax=Tokyovirus A1 TaxID=1826170 RepID=UPI0007A98A07|nr:putative F-box containing protein [Tokyovirus A1]BAU80329.1 putative F-box containing protein [Tokyovirus A1]